MIKQKNEPFSCRRNRCAASKRGGAVKAAVPQNSSPSGKGSRAGDRAAGPLP